MGKALIVFLAVVVATGPGAFGLEARSPAFSFVLMDGTVATGTIDTEEIAVETRYGDLKIPVGELVLLTPGLNSHPELAERVGLLLPLLGSSDTVVRERAKKKLIELGPSFQTIIAKYAEDQPAERKALFRQSLEAYKKAGATTAAKSLGWQDKVETRRFPVVGRITNRRFAVGTSYGRLNVKLSHIRRAAAAELASLDPEPKCDHIALKLLDGVNLKGKIDVACVAVVTQYGTLKVPIGHITTIVFNREDGTALVQLRSGDEVVGVTDVETLNVKTPYGKVSIPLPHIRHIAVRDGTLHDGLVLHYTFDGDSPNVVKDSSGNGNDGYLVGSINYEESIKGKAPRLTSHKTYILHFLKNVSG